MRQSSDLTPLIDGGNLNKFSINVDVEDEKGNTVRNYKFNAKNVMGWWIIEAKTLNSPFERSKECWKDVRTAISDFMNEPISLSVAPEGYEKLSDNGGYEIIYRKGESPVMVKDMSWQLYEYEEQSKSEEIKIRGAEQKPNQQAPEMEFIDGFGMVDGRVHASDKDVSRSRYLMSQRAADIRQQVGTTTANRIANDAVLRLFNDKKTTANMHSLESNTQDVTEGNFIAYLESLQNQISHKNSVCSDGVQMVVLGITHRGVFQAPSSNHAVLAVFTNKGVEIIDSKKTNPPRHGYIYHVTRFQSRTEHNNCARFAAYTAIELAKLITTEGRDIEVDKLLAQIKKPSLEQLKALFQQ